MPILRRPVKGARSSSVHMMPETDGLSKLPDQPINVQPSRSEVGKKVNTMKERNKVVSPTSNPASAPQHLQRTAHPVVGRKRRYQQGGVMPHSLSQEQLDDKIKDWRHSPKWYNRASGRAELTDSPIDMVLLGGVANATGKVAGLTANFIEKKAGQELSNVLSNIAARNFAANKATKLVFSDINNVATPMLRVVQHSSTPVYAAKQGIDLINNK